MDAFFTFVFVDLIGEWVAYVGSSEGFEVGFGAELILELFDVCILISCPEGDVCAEEDGVDEECDDVCF